MRSDVAAESRGDDEGMVTAETAAVLPVLALVAAAMVWGISALSSQVRCGDAAREAARAAARGDPAAQIREIGLRDAPAGARLVLGESADGLVTVTVTAPVGRLGGWLPGVTVVGHAAAQGETAAG